MARKLKFTSSGIKPAVIFYELSHFYMGADNADPIVSTENIFSCVEEAAEGAVRSAVMFYRSTDEGGIWVKK